MKRENLWEVETLESWPTVKLVFLRNTGCALDLGGSSQGSCPDVGDGEAVCVGVG